MPSPAKATSPPQILSLNTSVPSSDSSWPEIDRPSISPITPTSEEPQPLPQPQSQTQHQPQPQSRPQHSPTATTSTSNTNEMIPPQQQDQQPTPLSLTTNPDAIALRTAISLLQLQRTQTTTDIQTLDQLRTAALADPEGFLASLSAPKPSQQDQNPKFPPIPPPLPGGIIRTPPIAWSKYHIVGPSLDRLHTQQQLYPGITEAQIQQSGHPPKHEVAAPYRPGVDRLEDRKK